MTGRKRTFWTDENDSPQVAWIPIQEEELSAGSPNLPSSAEKLAAALADLTEKQRFVMRLRWGLKTGEVYSYEEIAQMMGITKQSVAEIEDIALSMLHWSLGTLT